MSPKFRRKLKVQSFQDLVLLENLMNVLLSELEIHQNWPSLPKTYCTGHESCLKLVWQRTGRK